MNPAIRVEGLSKRYRIGSGPVGEYRTLRETIADAAVAPWHRMKAIGRGGVGVRPRRRDDDFWALKDVSFEVRPGEVVGIIGRNGAGKSTLLKILSRITEPTSGRAEVWGRVASLLEVGTGFHPELTGRENILLNGSILGMARAEIRRKFDSIIDFSGVEKFIDTPVKRYSSGMYVRLAFAVAAHLQPEILVVDEVLAVGDLAFQRKCMNQMQVVGNSGSAVLFVSHNMAAVEALCSRAIMLEKGRVTRDDRAAEVVGEYHRKTFEENGRSRYEAPASRPGIIRSIELLDPVGARTDFLPLGGMFRLRIGFRAAAPIETPTIGACIDDFTGNRILSLHTPMNEHAIKSLAGTCQVTCDVDRFPLSPGDYWIKVTVSNTGNVIDEIEHALCFSVVDGEAFGEGRGFHRGSCIAPSHWELGGGSGSSRSGADGNGKWLVADGR